MPSRTRNSPIAVAVSSRTRLRRKIMTPGEFLTFLARFANNAAIRALRQRNPTRSRQRGRDGIYHKKRQPRETAQRLRRRRRLRQSQAVAVGGIDRPRVERLCQRDHPPRRHGRQARRDAAAAQRPRHARRSRPAGGAGQGTRLPRQGVPLGHPVGGQAAERDRAPTRPSSTSPRKRSSGARWRGASSMRSSWRWRRSTGSTR